MSYDEYIMIYTHLVTLFNFDRKNIFIVTFSLLFYEPNEKIILGCLKYNLFKIQS